jgi:hypothetical protein
LTHYQLYAKSVEEKEGRMKLKAYLILLLAFCSLSIVCAKKTPKDYPLKPVTFTEVQINDSFWLPRMETNQKVTIPFAFKKSEETGRSL